jgi:hypothetical protein
MKSSHIRKWLLVGAIVTIGARVTAVWAQQDESNPFAQPSPERQPLIREYPLVGKTIELPDGGRMLMGKIRVNAKDSIRQAAEKLRDAKGNEARSEAEKELRDLLEQYFDDDLQSRQAELGEMEDRLAKLEKQLDRRESKKDEIVDLQVKVLVNQAEGLGFFTDTPGDGAGWNVSGQSIVVLGRRQKPSPMVHSRSQRLHDGQLCHRGLPSRPCRQKPQLLRNRRSHWRHPRELKRNQPESKPHQCSGNELC